MKTLLRCGFVALIVLSVAIQLTHGRRGSADSDPLAALAAGLERLNVRTGRPAAGDILTGHAPSCQQPLQAMLLRIDGADDGRMRGLRPDGGAARYIYLGAVTEQPNRAVILGRWVEASVLFTVGLRATRPQSLLVLVVLPRACPDLAALEWATLSPAD
jgi:hypothetical protein